ncbi:MAG: two pore domain potassium channel family protein [Acetobacteraceae bacterium]|nr:two pore domain potassium channel family protein [Acetobacteraceae bacterium]
MKRSFELARRIPHGETVLPYLLAALIVLMFVASPLADIGLLNRPLIGTMMIVVILAGLFALGGRGPFAAAVIALGVVLLVLQVLVIFITESWFDFLAEFAGVLFFISLCLVLLLSVFAPGRITINRVLGAIAVYLLLAMFFAESFDIVDRFTEGDAFIMGQQPTPYTAPGARFFYLSVISLTSVGFGDMAPVHPFARSLVMLEAILGQIYTTVILAWMVSLAVRGDRGT